MFLEFMMNTRPHCQAFKKQVLDAPAFREFAAQHLAVTIYDVVDLKALPEEEQKVAQAMQKRFRVQSVPTSFIFSAADKQFLRSEGYGGSLAETVVAVSFHCWKRQPPRAPFDNNGGKFLGIAECACRIT